MQKSPANAKKRANTVHA